MTLLRMRSSNVIAEDALMDERALNAYLNDPMAVAKEGLKRMVLDCTGTMI